MSAPRAWLPLYPADFIADTMHLSAEEIGAYMLILMAMWRAGGSLPDDDATIARIARLSRHKWNGMRATIRAFLVAESGRLTQKRLTAEYEKAQKALQIFAEKGRQGGNAKALKNNNTPLAGASAGLLRKASSSPSPITDVSEPSGSSPSVSVSEDKSSSTVPGRAKPTPAVRQADIDQIWLEAPRASRERSSRADVARAVKAAVQRGGRLDEIRPALARYFASDQAQREDWRACKGLHRLIECDRWRDWSATAEIVSIAAARPTPTPEQQAAELAYVRRLAKEQGVSDDILEA